jgi:NADH:ubiquinone oxidoreductase subunit 5 (subunit L)/multisubunit Na+/H+ antiporter MnhA subunit
VFFFSLLAASMAGVVLARDGVLFLVAWEVMSIAGWFLVTFEDEREDVRRAGMVYLVASHVGVVFLLVMFGLLARRADSFAFSALLRAGAPGAGLASGCFVLALIGFGTKAGFWFLHTWLPEAHPAAPSHVSATMSGVMIKMGIHGVLRALTFLGPPPVWCGTGRGRCAFGRARRAARAGPARPQAAARLSQRGKHRHHHEVHGGDIVGERVIAPVLRRILGSLGRLRVLQHGRVQLYLVYILVTVVAVLVWQLGRSP